MLSAREERHGDVVVVHASGEVDLHTAHILRDALSAPIAAGSVNIVADLSEVTFMDSSGLGVLVGRLKQVRVQGGSLHVVATHERVLRVFEVTGLDRVFPMHTEVKAAVAALDSALLA